ncbi:hypothetical protein [Variovorax boronicumulans]|uniref:hypothetical protein n=1 Tax=Variovorax boronicumulans TaxID=436515 RepID=UPI00085C39DE|nr:hypothetical protein [Variovorax boronicumulans]OEZ31164.1 hypothetical protein AO062_08885 [Variovorax boronicumulans]
MLNITDAIEKSIHPGLNESRHSLRERFFRYVAPHLKVIRQLYAARDGHPPESPQHAAYEDLIRQQARILIGDEAFKHHMEFDLTEKLGAHDRDLVSFVRRLESALVGEICALASGFYCTEQEHLDAYCRNAFSWWLLVETHGVEAVAQASRTHYVLPAVAQELELPATAPPKSRPMGLGGRRRAKRKGDNGAEKGAATAEGRGTVRG